MSNKRHVNEEELLDSFDLAEREIIKKKKKADDSKRRSQTWRDNVKKNEERKIAYKEKCHLRYLKTKGKLNLQGRNSLVVEHCIDEKYEPIINTPVGLIRYIHTTSNFEIQLQHECTVLNMDGNGSYGLIIMKGLYCYKINVATQAETPTATDLVYIYRVKQLYEKLHKEYKKNNTKIIHLSKPCNISFEHNSLNVISKIKDLRNCTAPYVGMSII